MIQAALAMSIPNLGCIFGGLLALKNNDWYENLNLPTFRPSNWTFPLVWIVMYTSSGYASFLVWKHGGGFFGAAQVPLIFYTLQVIISWMFSIAFFEMRYFQFVS